MHFNLTSRHVGGGDPVQVYEVGLDYFYFEHERTAVASFHSGEMVSLTSPKHCPQTYLLDSSKK